MATTDDPLDPHKSTIAEGGEHWLLGLAVALMLDPSDSLKRERFIAGLMLEPDREKVAAVLAGLRAAYPDRVEAVDKIERWLDDMRREHATDAPSH